MIPLRIPIFEWQRFENADTCTWRDLSFIIIDAMRVQPSASPVLFQKRIGAPGLS
jgi:hypothetical protein